MMAAPIVGKKIMGAPSRGFLLRGLAALVLHLAAVEAHAGIGRTRSPP